MIQWPLFIISFKVLTIRLFCVIHHYCSDTFVNGRYHSRNAEQSFLKSESDLILSLLINCIHCSLSKIKSLMRSVQLFAQPLTTLLLSHFVHVQILMGRCKIQSKIPVAEAHELIENQLAILHRVL